MPFILTSDFPHAAPDVVLAQMRGAGSSPRIAWVTATSSDAATHFAADRERLATLGFSDVEACAIDEGRDEVQLAFLHEFAIIVLASGDPLRYRANVLRAGLGGHLRHAAARGRLIVAADGGAMVLTPSVALAQLASASAEEMYAARARFDAISLVPCELLPHRTRFCAADLAKLPSYSRLLNDEVVALEDDAAVFCSVAGEMTHVGGLTRYVKGQVVS